MKTDNNITQKEEAEGLSAVVKAVSNDMREKRKKVLEEVRKRRAEMYQRLRKEGKIQ